MSVLTLFHVTIEYRTKTTVGVAMCDVRAPDLGTADSIARERVSRRRGVLRLDRCTVVPVVRREYGA